MTYEAVIFDNDGVLVAEAEDSVLRRAAERAFEAVGVADPDPGHVGELLKGVTPETLARIADAYGFAPDEFWAARDRAASRAQIDATKNGGKELFADADVLHDLGVPAAVVSSNQQSTLEFLFSYYGLADRFVSVYGRSPTIEDLRRKKPAPYFVERALADLRDHVAGPSLAPDDVLMVGDNESDVRAAHAAGLDAAYLRRDGDAADLTATPDYELTGLSALPALLDGTHPETIR